MGRLVVVESPFAGEVEANVAYARAALRDCLKRGEYPIASHLLYTQPGVLDDDVPEERTLGIEAGLAWGRLAEATVVYTDRGMSRGMLYGIERAASEGRPVEYRSIAATTQGGSGPCLKQTVTATIVTEDGRRFVGTNYVRNAQPVCPRADLPTGVGYELCRSVCDQVGHAEVVAIAAAGERARGSTLYLEGHTYACEPCKSACAAAGIVEIVIGAPPAKEAA